MPIALIVDDEPQANRLLAMLLQIRGFQTVSAFQGADAIRLVRSERPDVVLLDLMLPDRTGLDVLAELRADPATSLLPIVVVTARLVSESKGQSLRAGASDYIHKPFTPEQVFGAVETACRRRQTLQTQPELVIPLGAADALDLDRHLGELRALLRARTPLPLTAIDDLLANLQALHLQAATWSPATGDEPVALVQCRIGPTALELTLIDEAGWLAGVAHEWASGNGLWHEWRTAAAERPARVFRRIDYRTGQTDR